MGATATIGTKVCKVVGITLVSLFFVILLGCSAIMDAVTPAYINPQVAKYADEPLTIFTPYTSLWDAKRINNKLDYMHLVKQASIKKMAEDDDRAYAFYNDSIDISIAGGEEFKGNVFSPTGPLGVLLAGIPGFTLGWLGLSKPSDKRKLNGSR